MKKVISSLFVFVFLTACSGNPPAWWNPGNVYSNIGRQSDSKESQPSKSSSVSTSSFEVMEEPQEESISVADESYEEMALTPLQDEENEQQSGDSSAQSVSNPEEDIPELGENPADEDFSAQPATDTASGGLPLPSVLE